MSAATAALALQGAVNVLWRGDAAVTALVGTRIWDAVPLSRSFPYIELGEGQGVDMDDGCKPVEQAYLTVHVWSRDPQQNRLIGKVEAWTIIGALKKAVWNADRQGTLVASGWIISQARVSGARVFEDPDGLTQHGVLTVEAVIEPAA
ncbi:hypothetical protein ATO13_21971 [Stappia sp. 22II-S9-Z10]|nr:hypothetical protein ATO13_21971 [Stappia sp. 22II-S9-Z10]